MKVFWSVDEVVEEMSGGALAIGNFDGVHLGHQALIKSMNGLDSKIKKGVLTFSPHPHEILQKNIPHFYLTSDEQKIRLFTHFGINNIIIHRLDRKFLELSPKAFIEDILVKKLKVKHVFVGEDFTYGNKALGNVDLLRNLGSSLGFAVHAINDVSFDGERCSSTAIRTCLKKGELFKANKMLGRPFSLVGCVAVGKQKGALLGCKTANIIPKNDFLLLKGVYATVTKIIDDKGEEHLSATNVGTRPTVTDEKTLVVESHCLDKELELYGSIIEVFFIERLRDEHKFLSLIMLQEEMQNDLKKTRQMYLEYPDRFRLLS